MNKEFNLRKRIQNQLIILCSLRYDNDCNAEQFAEATDKIEKYIEEFIKLLKGKVMDEINNPYTQKPIVHLGMVLKWIDELAGDFK